MTDDLTYELAYEALDRYPDYVRLGALRDALAAAIESIDAEMDLIYRQEVAKVERLKEDLTEAQVDLLCKERDDRRLREMFDAWTQP